MQTIVVPLRHLLPLLVLLVLNVCAWEVSATIPEVVHTTEPEVVYTTEPEVVHTTDTPTTWQTPKITINIAARRLYLYDERAALVKTYPVAVGSPRYRTPVRTQAMRTIVWNAWWIPPPSPWAKKDKPTPPGKNNPLGNIKMPIGNSLMVHGTNKARSIGTGASHSCIRMFTQDAWELARWIQRRSTAHHSDAVFAQYENNPRRSFSVQLDHTMPVDLVYTYVEVIADQLHVHHDIYGRIGNKLAHVMQTLAAHGYAADRLDQAALQARLTHAKFRDVVIALPDIRRQPQLHQPLASHIPDK